LGIHSFWIESLPGDWLFTCFSSYFKNSNDIRNIMLVLFAAFLIGAFVRRKWRWRDGKDSPLGLSVMVLGTTILLTYGIPYVRSLLVVPMLQDRYTIVILPAMLAAIAYGIELIPVRPRWKWIGVFILVAWSLQKEIGYLKIYSKRYKTQFREVTAFMAADSTTNHYPVLNDRIGWFELYYLRQFNYPGPLIDNPRAAAIDSLAKSNTPAWKTNGFWLMDAHGGTGPDNCLDSASRHMVDSLFVKVKEQRLLDAWAQLYVRRPEKQRNALNPIFATK
jgi:hypothetical protein